MKKVNLITGLSSAVITAALSLTAASVQAADVVYGDANCDGKVTIADSTAILQHLGNQDKYSLSPEGIDNADVYDRGDGITGMDAISIPKYDAKVINTLPESWLNGNEDPVSTETQIHLNGAFATVEGDYAEVDGGVITITHSGSFYVDGTLDDGQINVNVPDEAADPDTVKIFLNGVNITGKSAPAIRVTNAENTSINIADGTENFISDGDTAYASLEAVIEAKDDITFKGGELGTGVLNITANTQNAVVCNNDIKFTGATVNISTLNSTDKTNGVNGKTSVTVKGSTLNIDAEGDGLKSSKGNVEVSKGTVTIKAGNDAIQAETSIDVSGGVVVAGGDRGLTAVTGINITGGVVIATATDNQADSAIMGGTTQGTKLFNMVACADSTDGTWKKANTFGSNYSFTKKYAYVLISDPSFTVDSVDMFTNQSNGSAVMYGSGNFEFKQTDVVTAYDDVNPAAAIPPTTPDPDPSPSSKEDTYTVTLSGTSILSDAPAEIAALNNNVLTITQPGIFSVSGDANDVQIVVDVDKTAYPDAVVELDLVDANISNSTTAPIYVANIGDEVQIVAKKTL